jgi:hypothetical protein
VFLEPTHLPQNEPSTLAKDHAIEISMKLTKDSSWQSS